MMKRKREAGGMRETTLVKLAAAAMKMTTKILRTILTRSQVMAGKKLGRMLSPKCQLRCLLPPWAPRLRKR